jgi:hypothetical protein
MSGLTFPAAQWIIDATTTNTARRDPASFEARARLLAQEYINQGYQLDEANRLGRMRHKRGEYAAQIMAGMYSQPGTHPGSYFAPQAVEAADALIRELAKPQPPKGD